MVACCLKCLPNSGRGLAAGVSAAGVWNGRPEDDNKEQVDSRSFSICRNSSKFLLMNKTCDVGQRPTTASLSAARAGCPAEAGYRRYCEVPIPGPPQSLTGGPPHNLLAVAPLMDSVQQRHKGSQALPFEMSLNFFSWRACVWSAYQHGLAALVPEFEVLFPIPANSPPL
jgi:hypothetical protein